MSVPDTGFPTNRDPMPAGVITKSSTAGRVEFSSIQEFNFDANNRDNTIEVHRTFLLWLC